MDNDLGKINQREGQISFGDNSMNSETAISVGSSEITDSNAKSHGSAPKKSVMEDQKAKVEDEHKCSSHVIDMNCNSFLGGNQRPCRICHLNAKESGQSSVELMELGCECKGELGVAHLNCAEAWFRVRGNRLCEICSQTAKNVTGVGDIGFMDEWSEGRSGGTAASSPDGSRSCLRGQPLCNFLMACLSSSCWAARSMQPRLWSGRIGLNNYQAVNNLAQPWVSGQQED